MREGFVRVKRVIKNRKKEKGGIMEPSRIQVQGIAIGTVALVAAGFYYLGKRQWFGGKVSNEGGGGGGGRISRTTTNNNNNNSSGEGSSSSTVKKHVVFHVTGFGKVRFKILKKKKFNLKKHKF